MKHTEEPEKDLNIEPQDTPQEATQSTIQEEQPEKVEKPDAVAACEVKMQELNDKYMRLAADFDNYRKRTLKEKSDLLQNGSERAIKDLLPVIDDLELALKHMQEGSDVASLREGVELIVEKFKEYLKRQGVEEVEAIGFPFNDEQEQAIATMPAPTPEQKGMVLDCTKKGYTLHGRVMRFADVVVGE